MIRVFVCCITLFLVKGMCAQPLVDGNQQGFEVGVHVVLSNPCNVENRFSNIPYSGINGGLGISLKYYQAKITQLTGFSYSTGNMQALSASEMNLSSQYLNAWYSFLYNMYTGRKGSFNLSAGGSVDWLAVKRKYSGFINNSYSSESVSSLGVTIELKQRFEFFLKGITLSDRINLPVLSYIVQPWRPAADQKDYQEKRFAGMGSFLRLGNVLEIQKNISLHHSLALSYVLTYYRIGGFSAVKNLMPSLDFSYKYIF